MTLAPGKIKPAWMTLRDYQASDGVSLKNQITLINNREFARGFHPAVFPFATGKDVRNSFLLRFLRLLKGRKNITVSLSRTNNLVFLGFLNKSMDAIQDVLIELFELIRDHPHRRFQLLIGKGDYEIGPDTADLMPENLVLLVANNINISNPRIFYLPMGRDFRNSARLRKLPPSSLKSILVYCNFSLNTHPVRAEIVSLLEGKEFIRFEHMGNFLEYSVSREMFLSTLSRAKFAICPRGNAIDTFRLWDCLYLGTIPIVVKEATFHGHLTDLPILFLNNVQEFGDLTEQYLEARYAEIAQKEFNYSKLNLNYWLSPFETKNA